MKKIFHLSSCSTCQRILQELSPDSETVLQDIKVQNIDAVTLDWLKEKAGSYEALFSKRAIKYRSLGLNEQALTEADYREWLLKEYTFLKRPVIVHGENVFVGNAKKEVEAAKAVFQS
jgi:arsenate reductase